MRVGLFCARSVLASIALLLASRSALAEEVVDVEPRRFLAIGFGPGALTGTEAEPFSNAVATKLSQGTRVGRGFHVVVELDSMLMARYAPDPSRSQNLVGMTLGLRWTPFPVRPRHIDLRSIYFKASAGLGAVDQLTYSSVFDRDDDRTWGLVSGGAFGWQPIRAPDYALGFELADLVIVADGHTRQSIGLTVTAQLNLPTFRRRSAQARTQSTPPSATPNPAKDEQPLLSSRFMEGVRSASSEQRLRSFVEKELTEGSPPINFDLECRDRICRITPDASVDGSRFTEAIDRINQRERPAGLFRAVQYEAKPFGVYFELEEQAVIDFKRGFLESVRNQVAAGCKQKHSERGDVYLALEAKDGRVVATFGGEIGQSAMGACLRAALDSLLPSVEFVPGILPWTITLRLADGTAVSD
ncbi:MAG TPA: hypothetical protein VIV40_23055 [Kofleriaceae bacterium]